jgi:pimeloyl-[acyl-carrier protein] methyl ester esterase
MSVRFESRGHGPDLVLLHGWGVGVAPFAALVAQLARSARVHIMHLPGYGGSSEVASQDVNSLADAIAAAAPPRAMVTGWSLGGQVALAWALRHPAQVSRLVLFATTPRFVRGDGWEHGVDESVLDGFARGIAGDATAMLERFHGLVAAGDSGERAVRRTLAAKELPASAATLAAGIELLRTTDLRAGLQRIAQPALVIHGERDAVIPCAAGAALAAALPAGKWWPVADAGHAPFLGREAAAAARMLEFLDG